MQPGGEGDSKSSENPEETACPKNIGMRLEQRLHLPAWSLLLLALRIYPMIEVQQIDDIEALGAYRLLWTSWLPETPRASFFNTLEWLETYWRHFGHDQQLRALLVRSARQTNRHRAPLHSLAAAPRRHGPRARLPARRLGQLVRPRGF